MESGGKVQFSYTPPSFWMPATDIDLRRDIGQKTESSRDGTRGTDGRGE